MSRIVCHFSCGAASAGFGGGGDWFGAIDLFSVRYPNEVSGTDWEVGPPPYLEGT
jgi:hypothetical protein